MPQCNCTTCNGALVPAHVIRNHKRSNLLNETLQSQIHYKRIAGRIIPGPQSDVGPVPRGFAVSLCEPAPSLSPHFEPHFSDSAVLDSGCLRDEDLRITTQDDAMPHLGPFHSLEALLTAVNHFDKYNSATAAGSRPLTPHDAHHLPADPDQANFDRELQRALEYVQEHQDEEEEADPDMEVNTDEYEDLAAPAQPGEDNPDPFLIPDDLSAEDATDLTHLPGHLLSIYALVSWLHLQFHLPRVTCNALLTILGFVLLSISPNIETPFVTLQSSNRVLGIDKPIYTLPHTMKIPVVKYPYLPLSHQFKSLLKIPGLEALLDSWRSKPRAPNQYLTVVSILELTGFPIYEAILPRRTPHVRPRSQYLICHRNIDGIKIPTESCPEGRLVRVILVAVVCDKPATHKIGGFASHSHTNFLLPAKIRHLPLRREMCPAFKVRTDAQHCELGELYRNLTTPNARKTFVKDFATRYTQLSHLPYFNIVEQVIIDPMHNLFLGSCGKLPMDIGMPSGGSLTADQWLLLSTVYGPIIIPQLWSTCLPSDTDNQILQQHFAMIQRSEADKQAQATHKAEDKQALAEAKKRGKEAFEAEKARIASQKLADAEAKKNKLRLTAVKQAEKAQLAAEKKARAAQRKGKCKATEQSVPDLPEGQPWSCPPPRESTSSTAQFLLQDPEYMDDIDPQADDLKFSLHPEDPANFLKLSAVLRILIKHQLSDEDLDEADQLIRDYCTELLNLYSSNVVKPNHHYTTHVVEYARNFGPLHDFWTFLFERLNKVLKSYKTNNHANGELETTFFKTLPHEVANVMIKASNEERGTVAGLAALTKDLDDAVVDAVQIYSLSPRHRKRDMSMDTYRLLAQSLCFRFPHTPVHCRTDRAIVPQSLPLNRQTVFFDYVIVDGKALLRFPYSRIQPLLNFHGEEKTMWFARMRWFKPWGAQLSVYAFGNWENIGIATVSCHSLSSQTGSLASLE
ncbi:uncharacterized protein F5891DRAFT_974250 [Suillus fuscotomentosus]|uniref:Uncharacterized protein n=1 Tax=Suillus fuscotomentosus TaxID=1912939 RepID=A0AAD4EK10_9AGAM|nr:uncharacterized protein F5891DRAFT_974250 [Suillus fuscotomentosus]KAG1907550.1 hypothetical protein F5891DRAFT_974250 [Suillus fuscotomentosus]